MDEANHRLDSAAEAVERAPDGVQMFRAAAVCRRVARSSIIVESANGLVLDRDTDKASRVRDHFSSLLCTLPQAVTGAGDLPLPLPLVEEITASEITVALSRMTNQRAAGPDGWHAELLKYGAEYLSCRSSLLHVLDNSVTTLHLPRQSLTFDCKHHQHSYRDQQRRLTG